MSALAAPCETALVTGAAAGIGRALTRALRDAGVRVAALDRDAEGLATLRGERVHPVVVDLLDPVAAQAAVEHAWSALGRIEGVASCAGIYPVTPLMDLAVEEWDRVLALNLRAPFIVGRGAARLMVEHGVRGRIVNISSTAATFCRPGVAHYGSSKAGLNQLTRDMAIELAPHGIRVNAVAPGLVATEKVMQVAAEQGKAEHEAKLARIPLGREAGTEDIVPLIMMLLGDASAYCTGSVLLADGGMTLGLNRY
jgi:NAD(P)-dependent dehydrogenase (short-subunit alcohol dehydrogenase family)